MKKSVLISAPSASDLKDQLSRYAESRHLDIRLQSPGEKISADEFDFLVIEPSNPETAMSLAQKFAETDKYIIEVRRDNPFKNGGEPIRVNGAQIGLIAGLGDKVFETALKAIAMKIKAK